MLARQLRCSIRFTCCSTESPAPGEPKPQSCSPLDPHANVPHHDIYESIEMTLPTTPGCRSADASGGWLHTPALWGLVCWAGAQLPAQQRLQSPARASSPPHVTIGECPGRCSRLQGHCMPSTPVAASAMQRTWSREWGWLSHAVPSLSKLSCRWVLLVEGPPGHAFLPANVRCLQPCHTQTSCCLRPKDRCTPAGRVSAGGRQQSWGCCWASPRHRRALGWAGPCVFRHWQTWVSCRSPWPPGMPPARRGA